MNIRKFALAAGAASALAAVSLAGAPGAHPHFDDKGTLAWSTKVADAQVAAKNADRLIFIEFGREG